MLRFANVSSRHTELEFLNGFWYARDLDSTNGTYIDGKSCQYDCVKPDSVLAIGRHRFTLVYEAVGDAPTSAPTSEEVIADGLMRKAGIEPESDDWPESDSAKSIARSQHRGQLFPVGGGVPIALKEDHLLVGRDRGCAIRLQSKTVSSRHCELEFVEGYWLVRDLGSHNGTKVDGKKIEQSWLLPNCLLQISNLRFNVRYRPTPGAPIPKDAGISFTRGLLERAGLKRRR